MHPVKRSCYPTKEKAISACLRSSRRWGRAFRPYYCHSCKAWHITDWKKA